MSSYDLVHDFLRRMELLYAEGTPEYNQCMDELKTQLQIEESKFSIVKNESVESIKLSELESFEISKLSVFNRDHPFDSGLMEVIIGILNTVLLRRDLVRNYLGLWECYPRDRPLMGLVIQSSLMSENDHPYTPQNDPLFIIKTSQFSEHFPSLRHEWFVGTYGTNQLRHLGIPNFAYIYGGFSGSPPFCDNHDHVLTFCNSERCRVPYVIYENINPAKSLSELCFTCSPQEFMDYYLQVMIALKCANERCGFTHYDCHSDNILIRDYQTTPFALRYPTNLNGNPVYIISPGGIATCIDYEMSHIQTSDGNHYGYTNENFAEIGAFRNEPNLLHDAYKLLCICLYMMIDNRPTFTILQELLSFYTGIIGTNITDYEELIRKERDTFYVIPWSREQSGKTLEMWIGACRHFCLRRGLRDPISETLPDGIPLFSPRSSPRTEILASLPKVVSNPSFIEDLQSRLQQIIVVLSQYPYHLPTDYEMLYTPEELEIAKTHYISVAVFFDLTQRLRPQSTEIMRLKETLIQSLRSDLRRLDYPHLPEEERNKYDRARYAARDRPDSNKYYFYTYLYSKLSVFLD